MRQENLALPWRPTLSLKKQRRDALKRHECSRRIQMYHAPRTTEKVLKWADVSRNYMSGWTLLR
jgi:hypothetical protein